MSEKIDETVAAALDHLSAAESELRWMRKPGQNRAHCISRANTALMRAQDCCDKLVALVGLE